MSAAFGLLLAAGAVYASVPTSSGGTAGSAGAPDRLATAELPADARPGRAGSPASAGEPVVSLQPMAALEDLEARVDRLNRGWTALAAYYDARVVPIRRALLRYKNDPELTSEIATAVVREANAAGLDPRLLLGVLLVENPWLNPGARSSAGAVGLMQVMPVHAGGWSCGSDLEQIDTNICLGARVFAYYLDRSDGNLEKALLHYNGCVTGSNTPNCHQYPARVLARARAASVLAWVGQGVSAGAP